MNLGDFLEIIVDSTIEGSQVKCYKRVYITYVDKEGKKTSEEFNYEKVNEIKKKFYDLKLISLESMKKRHFMFSNGLEIHVTVLK